MFSAYKLTILLQSVDRSSKVEYTALIDSQSVRLELNTAISGNIISTRGWSEVGQPELERSVHSISVRFKT